MLSIPSILKAAPLQALLVGAALMNPAGPAHPADPAPQAGTIVTIAGSALYPDYPFEPGFRGDGGPATQAVLSNPQAMTFDLHGNLYVADMSNQRVRKIDPNGIITTVVGDGPDGVQLNHNGGIGTIGSSSGDGGLATAAHLSQPIAVAVDDSGNLYVSEQDGGRVREVTTDGIIHTVAGGGTADPGDGGRATAALLNQVEGVVIDANNDLLLAENGNNRIRTVGLDGRIHTVAGRGLECCSVTGPPDNDGIQATMASLFFPKSVTLDLRGDLFIADQELSRIFKVTPDGLFHTVIVPTDLHGPESVVTDAAGNLFVADTQDYRILEIHPNGRLSSVAGTGKYGFSGDGGPATHAEIGQALGLAVDASGNLFISDEDHSRIREVYGVAAPGLHAGRPFPGSGDVNRDGRVDLQDAILALKGVTKAVTLTPEQRAFGDVDGDGSLDLKDVTSILKRSVGL